MAHPLLEEARRQAEKLNRYCVRHHKGCAILWRYGDGWQIAEVFPSDEAAESYLMSKLPAPTGDI